MYIILKMGIQSVLKSYYVDITELVVGFEKTSLNISESGKKVEVCVNITQPSSFSNEIKFNLTVRTQAGTAGELAAVRAITQLIKFICSMTFGLCLSLPIILFRLK